MLNISWILYKHIKECLFSDITEKDVAKKKPFSSSAARRLVKDNGYFNRLMSLTKLINNLNNCDFNQWMSHLFMLSINLITNIDLLKYA